MKVMGYCWTCNKEHDITNIGLEEYSVKCECGGFIVTPSGKTYSKLIPETMEEKIMLGLITK
jgi:hypothetical protein